MTRLLGIDLGTSSVKAVIIDEHAHLLGVGGQEYPIDVPQPGYAEQDPENWWQATIKAVRQALSNAGDAGSGDEIAAIGFSGQMHGGVLLSKDKQPVGPAIIWADQRSAGEVDELLSLIGMDQFARIAGTAPAAGFFAPTLRWLQKHDPARLDRSRYILLPKDYVRLKLTGEVGTDASDASATALFDVRQRQWSSVIIEMLDLPDLWPEVFESTDIVGALTKEAADALGLPVGIPVAAGCSDQPAQAVGNGLIDPGNGSVTLGTGGQMFAALSKPIVDSQLRLHTFCHAPMDRWYMLGAMLAAGLSLRWLRDTVSAASGTTITYSQLEALAAQVQPGANGLLFLPYLVGERAPVMDPLARGCFIGLTLEHGAGHLARAIMEGVAFNFRQILDLMTANVAIDTLLASGGGLVSPTWRHIVCDVLNRPLRLATEPERAGVGAAMLGGIGVGVYADYADARRTVQQKSATSGAGSFEITEPDAGRSARYAEEYDRYVRVYPLLKPLLNELSRSQTRQQ